MEIVGVFNNRLKNYCYGVDNIRPLHIAQSLASSMHNLNYAHENNDYEFMVLCQKEMKDLYREAREKYGLSISQINWFAWYEFMSDITNFKHSILNSKSVRNNRY
jgi:hypothetical protein